jgi:solute carrier family 25 phosphate transporter 23/24/25/41
VKRWAAGCLGSWLRAQILRVVPYSAIQLCTYEAAKRTLRDGDGGLSVPARLAAGACAGMTATLVLFRPVQDPSVAFALVGGHQSCTGMPRRHR